MTTEQIKDFMTAPIKVGDYVTLEADKPAEDDNRALRWDSVGVIKEILPDGTYKVGKKDGEDNIWPSIYNKDEITKFLLWVEWEGQSYFGTFYDFYEPYSLIEIINLNTGEVIHLHEDYLYNGVINIIKNPLGYPEYLRRMGQHPQSLKNVASMREVSKQGVMEHLNKLNPNVKGKIMSFISGYNVGTPNEKAHMKILQEYMTRPQGTPGAGVNMRYGKELPLPPPQSELNRALYIPLPYGPSEANFMGGKRSKRENSRGKIGTQMARRGTRRSRGIFSRLYAPIGHLLSAGKESVGAVTNTAKGVVGEGIHGLDKIGRSVTKHANMAVKDVFTRKGGKRKTRKSRRNTRRRR